MQGLAGVIVKPLQTEDNHSGEQKKSDNATWKRPGLNSTLIPCVFAAWTPVHGPRETQADVSPVPGTRPPNQSDITLAVKASVSGRSDRLLSHKSFQQQINVVAPLVV